jgi:hypothetical protein
MLPSFFEHDEPAPVFISNGGSMWPRHCDDIVNGSIMLAEPPEEGSSAYKSPACNGLAAPARVHEPDMTTMRTKSMGTTTSFLIHYGKDSRCRRLPAVPIAFCRDCRHRATPRQDPHVAVDIG